MHCTAVMRRHVSSDSAGAQVPSLACVGFEASTEPEDGLFIPMPTAEKFRPTLDVASTPAHLAQGSLGSDEGQSPNADAARPRSRGPSAGLPTRQAQ
jgi:hypothetical protein